MLCVPRSVSPVDLRGLPPKSNSSPPSSSKSKLFSRTRSNSKISSSSKSAPNPTPSSASSSSDTSGSSTSTAETSVEDATGNRDVIAQAFGASISKRAGSKLLDFVRTSAKSKGSKDATVLAGADSEGRLFTSDAVDSGTLGHTKSGPNNDNCTETPTLSPATENTGRTFSLRLGLNWKSKDSRPTEDELQNHGVHKPTAVALDAPSTPAPAHYLNSESESEDDDDDSNLDTHTFDSDDDMPPPPHPHQPNAPPSVFYPQSSHRPPMPEVNRRQQPPRSHLNLLQLTNATLQSSPSPHPLITPRSTGGSASAQLFPRSCNLSRPFPRPRSIAVTVHKTRIVRRLESPGNLTAAEELSIMPFATRLPGSRGSDRGDRSATAPNNSIYPSSSTRRTSLMRSLYLEDGDLMREVDVNAHVQSHGFPTFSKGLKRWVQRPSFEQRAVMWIPASYDAQSGVEIGVIRNAVHRPALKGPAALEFSEGLEALAGVIRPRTEWRSRSCPTVTQVVPTLHHPQPQPGTLPRRFSRANEGLASLYTPSPPGLSSSPTSTASTDTAPTTPKSNHPSSQNLPSFATPAFIKRLRQNNALVDLNISDEDDLPLGVVVINKRASFTPEQALQMKKMDDRAEKQRRAYEKEREKEKRKAQDAQKKRTFKEQVLASRMRSHANRTGRTATLSDEWIEVDEPAGKTMRPKGQLNQNQEVRSSSPRPARPKRDSVRSETMASSSRSIRSQSSAGKSRQPRSTSPTSHRSRSSVNMTQFAAMPTPAMMAYPMPGLNPYATPNMNAAGILAPTFFVPPPGMPQRSSSTGSFAAVPPQVPWTMPGRSRSASNVSGEANASQYLGPPEVRRRESASDGGIRPLSRQSGTLGSRSSRPPSSMKIPRPRMSREIS